MTNRCDVIPAGLQGYILQGLLGVLSLATLYLKPVHTRSRNQFIKDSVKQMCGAALIHVLNVICAESLSETIRVGNDKCEWYFIQIMVDTTSGVLVVLAVYMSLLAVIAGCSESGEQLAFKLVQSQRKLADRNKAMESLLRKGDEEAVTFATTIVQIIFWLCVVTVAKFATLLGMWAFNTPLQQLSFVFKVLPWEDTGFKLYFVVIIVPTIMNALQFWLQDEIFRFGYKAYKLRQVAAERGEIGLAADESNSRVEDMLKHTVATESEILNLKFNQVYETLELAKKYLDAIPDQPSKYMSGTDEFRRPWLELGKKHYNVVKDQLDETERGVLQKIRGFEDQLQGIPKKQKKKQVSRCSLL